MACIEKWGFALGVRVKAGVPRGTHPHSLTAALPGNQKTGKPTVLFCTLRRNPPSANFFPNDSDLQGNPRT